MNDQSPNPSPSMDLPQPEVEMLPPELSTDTQAEAPQAIAVETNPISSQAPPPAMLPAVTPTDDPAEPTDFQVPPTHDLPQIADDNDLIEKEWVEKAKAIVQQTKHDPYLQTKEMSRVKADYLKKRYNKDVKVSSE